MIETLIGLLLGIMATALWFTFCLGLSSKCQCEDCPLKSRCDNGNYPLFEEPKE